MKTVSIVIVAAFAAGTLPAGCAAPAGVEQTATTQSRAASDAVILLKGLT